MGDFSKNAKIRWQDDGWLADVNIVPSPNFNHRPIGEKPDLLVIHNISLPPGQFGTGCVERFFQNQLDSSEHPFFKEIEGVEVSAHFFIKRTGEVIQFVSTEERAWHAGKSEFLGRENCNDFSIGIEMEGTDDQAYEHAQYLSLVQVTKTLMMAYPNLTPQRITGHSDIAPGRKTDPGAAFDWEYYRTLLAED
ncbi:1,6-anhydro-N-acetylmuramyl-L-alanine amidase AmpD [Litoribrevibacter euphylliae]|uniref:1,6-anhydro-N-acetylmuramyl-L-alanine amidase AmpD n=1 Tax=Litoribrevibacter euphylliae TaxID=1834034 RepID=A0ABV7HDM6_9GAMM